jgi:hypothetical protein
MCIVHFRLPVLFKCLLLLLPLYSLFDLESRSQNNSIKEPEVTPFSYDEVSVLVMVDGFKYFYLDALYSADEALYLSVGELFRTLGIQCGTNQKGDSIGGFLGSANQTYSIDFIKGQISDGSKLINAKSSMVLENGILYLESSIFAEAFGIKLTFNFRTLTLILKSDFELPAIRQMRLEKMRSNITKLRGEEIADTMLKRNYHLLKLGMVDWSVAFNQTWNGVSDNRFGLGVGTELLFGEADISLNYYDRYKFDNRQLYYVWRWVDNDKKLIRQAQAGKISNQSISFINSPVIGAVIRNTPTTLRKARGYYTLSEFTEPNWTVELYINNVLVDYTKADESGLFVFKVPVVYGYTTIKLMFYGLIGEERTEERTMNVPYTVMPAGEFEYGLSAGVLQDSSLSRFGRGEFNYGINRFLTLGGGVEYLSSIPNGSLIPFARTTIQPFSKMIFTGEYAYGVKTSGLMDLYLRKDALLEIDYTKYFEGQLATRFNAPEERKIKLSIPFRYKKIIGFSRFDFSQFLYKAFNYYQANAVVSVYYNQFSANSSTKINWIENRPAFIISDLALSYRLGKGYKILSSGQYNGSENRFMSYKIAFEKSIPKGYFSFTWERNFLYGDNFVNLNMRYDLSFARATVSALHSKGKFYTSVSTQGSLALGSGNNYIHGNKNPSVGRGGISLYPFLDLNHNGIFDKGERMIKLTNIKIMGSKPVFSEKDSIIRIPDLISFTSYIIEFSDSDLENIAWRFKYKTYQVLIDPNQFKRIDIPIISVGEVSGVVSRNVNTSLKGIGRILIKIYKNNGTNPVTETLTESDGYFNYLGLEPGKYVARIDSVQLSNLNFTADPEMIEFTIKPAIEGDIITGIDFVLNDRKNKELKEMDALPGKSIKTDSDLIE